MFYTLRRVPAGTIALAVVMGLAAGAAQAGSVRIITTGPSDTGVLPPPEFAMPAGPPTMAVPPIVPSYPMGSVARPVPPGTVAPFLPPPEPLGMPGAPPMPDAPTATPWGPAAPGQPYGPGVIWIRNPDNPPPDTITSVEVAQPAAPMKLAVMTYLGASVAPVGEAMADQLKLPPGTGLMVNDVEADSPAAKAGLKRFDVITWLNGQLIVNPPQLHTLVRLHKAGETVTLRVIRAGKEQAVPVTLAEAERPVGGMPGGWGAGMTGGPGGATLVLPQGVVTYGIAGPVTAVPDGAWATSGGPPGSMGTGPGGVVLFGPNGPLTTGPGVAGPGWVGGMTTTGRAEIMPGAPGQVQRLDNTMIQIQRGAPGQDARPIAGKEVPGGVTYTELGSGPDATRSIADNEHSFTFTAVGGKTNLVVKDTRGKVLFEGPINTDEELKAVPEPIRAKLKTMNALLPPIRGGQGPGESGRPPMPPSPVVPRGPVAPPPATSAPGRTF